MQTILYMAVSLDGKTTRGPDDTSWVEEEDVERMNQLMEECGVMLMGSRTYLSFGEDLPSERALQVVCTKNQKLLALKRKNVRFTTDSIPAVLDSLASEGFEKILLAGGAQFNTSVLGLDVIDEIRLIMKPTILGKGNGLFNDLDEVKQFELISVEKLDYGSAELRFRRKN